MMKQRLLKSIEVKVFAHATENIDKVKESMKNILPYDFPTIFQEQKLKGYYGDPITILTVTNKRRKPSTEAFENLFKKLPIISQEEILMDPEKRIDDSGNFYMRLDKQKAYQNKISTSNSDPIRIKFGFRTPHKTDPKETITDYLKNLMNVRQENE
jgi:RNA binding exosome subunit